MAEAGRTIHSLGKTGPERSAIGPGQGGAGTSRLNNVQESWSSYQGAQTPDSPSDMRP